MATASVTYTFTAGTAAVASQVNTNFADLVNFLNGSVVHKDGAIAMTGRLTLASLDPTSVDHAVRRGYTDLLRTVVRLRRSPTQVVSSGSFQTVSWNTEDFDPEAWIVTPSGTVTCKTAATYAITASGLFSTDPLECYAKLTAGSRAVTTTAQHNMVGATLVVPLAVNETITFQIAHIFGANLDWGGNLDITRVTL